MACKFYRNNSSITIYPYPSSTGYFQIETNEEIIQLELFNVLGEKINTPYLTDMTINLSRMKSGIYLLKIPTENEIFSRKLVVK